MSSANDHTGPGADDAEEYAADLERATRGLLELNVTVLEILAKKVGLPVLSALQSLQRLGPSIVTELGDDLDLRPATASRLSDRLAETGLITRRVSPTNRRATLLELTDAGHAVLDELILLRQQALTAVAQRMIDDDRDALLQGAHAFTVARQQLSD